MTTTPTSHDAGTSAPAPTPAPTDAQLIGFYTKQCKLHEPRTKLSQLRRDNAVAELEEYEARIRLAILKGRITETQLSQTESDEDEAQPAKTPAA